MNNERKNQPNIYHGLWCSLLLPFSLVSSNYYNDETDVYITACVLSFILLVEVFCHCVPSVNGVGLLGIHYGVYIGAVIGVTALYNLTDYRLMVILITIFASFVLFDFLFKTIISKCPCSFTAGEASIVSQVITFFVITCHLSFEETRRKTVDSSSELVQSTKFMQILLLGCFCVIAVLYNFPCWRSVQRFYLLCGCFGCLILIAWSIYMLQNPISWIFMTCTMSVTRMYLILGWIGLVVLTASYAVYCSKVASNPGSAIMRKYFHIIIISTFAPGLLLDTEFLYLASAVALAIFIALETFRVLRIPPVGPVVDSVFSSFLDEKDSGLLIVTHIYLLVGCSSPLWLYPPQKGLHMSHWSGIISVGLGDMVAAASGTLFGRHKWPNSKKTIEGTACAIIAQSIALYVLLQWSEMVTLKNLLLALFAAVAASITEAKTNQIDNLILPLVMFPILSFVN